MAVPLPSSEKAPYHIGYWLEIEEKLTNLQKHPSVDLLVVVILEFMSQAKSDRSKYFASCAAADEKSDFDDLKTLLFILLKEVGVLVSNFYILLNKIGCWCEETSNINSTGNK